MVDQKKWVLSGSSELCLVSIISQDKTGTPFFSSQLRTQPSRHALSTNSRALRRRPEFYRSKEGKLTNLIVELEKALGMERTVLRVLMMGLVGVRTRMERLFMGGLAVFEEGV